MPGQLELAGSQAPKPVPWAPLFIEDLWPGLYTNRAALHDPSGLYERKYMGGRPGSLIGGLNTEISVRNTIIRRYGVSEFSSAVYETPPLDAFSFQQLDGSIHVIVDTSTTGLLAITSCGNASAGQTTYFGTITGGANNDFVGLIFMVSGFVTNLSNNSPTGFVCTASTSTTLTLANPGGVAETHAATAISSGAVWIDNQDSTKTLLFAKGVGAGQTHFVAVAGILYMGDGVDTRKYTPGNLNGLIWNWGIAPPTAAPQLTVTESASSAATWVQTTMFTTMGLILDGNGNIESLISVNASGTNTTQFGMSGNGQPAWNTAPLGTTTDGSVTWTNWGQIPAWSIKTLYTNAGTGGGNAPDPTSQIYDPTSNTVQLNIAGGFASATSGTMKPAFAAVQGKTLHDPPGGNTPPNVKWFAMYPPPGPWQASHAYTLFQGTDTSNTAIIEPGTLPGSATSPVTLQICTTAGTSGSSGTQPPFPVLGTTNVQTRDNDLVWLSLGNAIRQNSTHYTAWSGQGSLFSAIIVSNRFYVCTGTGESAGSLPGVFSGTSYGTSVGDGSVTWTDVGPSTHSTWQPNTNWYLPLQGFAPTSSSQPYGGASITDSNGNLQTVTVSGLSKTSPHPSWAAAGATTSDGTITWFNEGVANVNALIWKTSHTWAYSYKARSLTDFYTLPIDGVVPVPPGILGPPYGTPPLVALPNPPTGSQTNAISTASPVSSLTGGNTGAVVTLKIPYSSDPQVDTIIIWRDADGGGSDNMFELTEAPNIPALAGTPGGFAMVQDYFPDVPSTINGVSYPGLNILIPAPIDGTNNPPDPTFLPEAYNFQRIWGPQGAQVNFSGGPDILVGNPNEAFSAADEFPYLSNVIRTVKSTLGLIVYTKNSIEIIEGGPLTASFNSVTLAAGVGLGNYNALDIFAGEQFFMDTTGQLRVLSPTLSLTSAGQPITDQLIQYDPTTAYIAFNEQPNDSAIYVGTGSAGFAGIGGSPTGWFRMNPRQVPGGANGPEPVWSPFAAITNGCRMLQSIEIAPGIKKLLIGSTEGGEPIRMRNLTVFTDEFVPQPVNPHAPGVDQVAQSENDAFVSTFAIGPLTPSVGNEWAFVAGISLEQATMSGAGWSAVATPFMFGKFIGNSTAPFTASGTFSSTGDYAAALLLFYTNGIAPTQAQLSSQFTLSGTTASATFGFDDVAGNTLIAWVYGAAGSTPSGITATDTEGNTWAIITITANTNRWIVIGVANNIVGGTLNEVTFHGFNLGNAGFVQMTEYSGLGNAPPTILSQYDANFQIGNVWLAHRGEIAVTKFIECDFAEVTTNPTVSYLLNEISGTFTDFTSSRFDPPQVYGDLFAPTSYNPLRYYFSETGSLARCVHMQVGVDFGTNPNADEIYNLTIYGQVLKGL